MNVSSGRTKRIMIAKKNRLRIYKAFARKVLRARNLGEECIAFGFIQGNPMQIASLEPVKE